MEKKKGTVSFNPVSDETVPQFTFIRCGQCAVQQVDVEFFVRFRNVA